MAMQTPWFLTSGIQICESTSFCCFKIPGLHGIHRKIKQWCSEIFSSFYHYDGVHQLQLYSHNPRVRLECRGWQRLFLELLPFRQMGGFNHVFCKLLLTFTCTISADTNTKLTQNRVGSHGPRFFHKFYSWQEKKKGRITITSVRSVWGDVVGNNKQRFKGLKEENYLYRSSTVPAVMFLPSI